MSSGMAPSAFVFDFSPLMASCQFAVGSHSVAEIALAAADVRIPPAVYAEVVTRGGSRPDARIAAGLINAGYIRVAEATLVGQALEDLMLSIGAGRARGAHTNGASGVRYSNGH
jgi:hypothetical protein